MIRSTSVRPAPATLARLVLASVLLAGCMGEPTDEPEPGSDERESLAPGAAAIMSQPEEPAEVPAPPPLSDSAEASEIPVPGAGGTDAPDEGGELLEAPATCQPDGEECRGSQRWRCDGRGRWFQLSTCGGSFRCVEAGSRTECVRNGCDPGAEQCRGRQRWRCDRRGTWQQLSTCGGAYQCRQDGQLTECAYFGCQPGTEQCRGNQRWGCDSRTGNWYQISTCGAQFPCRRNGARTSCG